MMIQLTSRHLYGFSGVMVVGLIAAFIHSHFLLNWDVSWDLLAAKRLAAGGTYSRNFFDLNPPLILYLLIPPVWLSEWLSINTIPVFYSYVFGLSICSFLLCYFLAKPVFLKTSNAFFCIFLISIAAILLLLPSTNFGEREHFLLIFSLPYFFTVIYRLDGHKLPWFYGIVIGIFSFMGFALKPYFFLAFILVECYAMFYTRRFFSWFRTEIITIFICSLSYIVFIFVYHPDYLFVVVPNAMPFYYLGFRDYWHEIFINYMMFFCYIAVGFYLFSYKNTPYKMPATVLLWALMGFIGSYALQQMCWAYHALPAFSLSFLLIIMLFVPFVIESNKNIFPLSLLAVLFFSIPVAYMNVLYTQGIVFKNKQGRLLSFLRAHAWHQPVYFISASPREIFPAVNYADVTYASRFLHLFWAPGMAKKQWLSASHDLSPEEKNVETSLVNMMAEDIRNNQPKFIFVDVREHKAFYSTLTFNYLSYLLKNERFRAIWKDYHYVTTFQAPISTTNKYEKKICIVRNYDNKSTQNRLGCRLIIVGEGLKRMIFYRKKGRLVKTEYGFLHTDLQLTEQELSKLPVTEGVIIITADNKTWMHDFINRVVNSPIYHYAVYQRDGTTPIGGV